MSVLFALLLAVTPSECAERPAWCQCRRHLAIELNRCQVAADKIRNSEERARARHDCNVQYETTKPECDIKWE